MCQWKLPYSHQQGVRKVSGCSYISTCTILFEDKKYSTNYHFCLPYTFSKKTHLSNNILASHENRNQLVNLLVCGRDINVQRLLSRLIQLCMLAKDNDWQCLYKRFLVKQLIKWSAWCWNCWHFTLGIQNSLKIVAFKRMQNESIYLAIKLTDRWH